MASQLSLLQRCLQTVHRTLAKRGSPLLAAKLILISRSLHRNIAKDGDIPILAGLGDRLATLRQRLLRLLDRRFEKIGGSPADLVADMTAFSLITSSSALDVVRHFQHLRLQTIKSETNENAHPGDRLKAYLRTQQELRAVFPDLLSASLRTVAARPLLQDPLVLESEHLSLDIYLDWISPEVKNFTPYARYKDLQQPESVTLLDTWTDSALSNLLSSVREDVGRIDDVALLVNMRKELIQAWLSSKKYKSRSSARDILDQLRSLFIDRLDSLLKITLHAVVSDVTTTIRSTLDVQDGSEGASQSLWTLSGSSMDFSNAAFALRRSIVDCRHGNMATDSGITAAFDRRWQDVASIQAITKRMRDTRWEDDLDDEDYDVDAEEDGERIADLLSKNDPSELERVLHDGAGLFMDNLENQIISYGTNYDLECDRLHSTGLKLLRALRELRQRLPVALQDINQEAARKLICQDLVITLHGRLTHQIVIKVEQDLGKLYLRSLQSSHRLTMLWDGTPPVPTQISPGCFRLFRALVKYMETFGADIWSPDVVHGLLRHLDTSVTTLVREQIRRAEEEVGHKTEVLLTSGTHSKVEIEPDENKDDAQQGTDEIAAYDQNTANDENTTTDLDSAQSEQANGATKEAAADTKMMTEKSSEADTAVKIRPSGLSKDHYLQLLFDVLYMINAFSTSQSLATSQEGESSLQSLVTELIGKAEASEGSVTKMTKGASDYWRKTYLLFGLLCT